MTDDVLPLIGRRTTHALDALETHAERLRRRGVVEAVHAVTNGSESVRELREHLDNIDADRVYAIPFLRRTATKPPRIYSRRCRICRTSSVL